MIRRVIAITLFTALVFGSSKVAIAINTKGDVSVTLKGLSTPQVLKPGTPLSDQDRIKTGKNGFITLMYLDDKTVVKMLDNSDMTIMGDRSGKKINKSLDIKYGRVAANVMPQKGKEFRVSTPTSVASVKGTELAIESDPSTGDSFTLIEGLIEVTNSITGESTEVQEGETAMSTPDGSLNVAMTTSDDLEGFEEASVEPQTQELRFEVEDEDGGTKQILIKFK